MRGASAAAGRKGTQGKAVGNGALVLGMFKWGSRQRQGSTKETVSALLDSVGQRQKVTLGLPRKTYKTLENNLCKTLLNEGNVITKALAQHLAHRKAPRDILVSYLQTPHMPHGQPHRFAQHAQAPGHKLCALF